LSVPELDVDALSGTGRKWLRGPRGTGFLYVRPRLVTELEPAVLDLHSATWSSPDSYTLAPDARRFEMWEADVAARLGLGAAVDYLLALGVDDVADAVAYRAQHLRDGLADIGGVIVRDLGDERSGIVSFTADSWEATRLRDALAERRITVTVSHRSSTLLDMSSRDLSSVVRASPHYFVSPSDVDRFLATVRDLVGR